MFSGIIEEAAQVVKLEKEKDNLHITMRCSFVNELKIDQSVSHSGVCLTVVKKTDDTYTVTAIKETLEKTNLGLLKPGDKVNLERSTRLDGRLDGHMVQGHVDQTAVCTDVKEAGGSWYYSFEYEPTQDDYITVENLGTETLKNLGAMIPISVFDLIKEKALKSDNPEFSYNEMLVKEMHKMNVKLCKQIMWVQIPKQRINEMFSEAWKMKGDPIRSYECLYQKEFSKYKGMENKENYNRETR